MVQNHTERASVYFKAPGNFCKSRTVDLFSISCLSPRLPQPAIYASSVELVVNFPRRLHRKHTSSREDFLDKAVFHFCDREYTASTYVREIHNFYSPRTAHHFKREENFLLKPGSSINCESNVFVRIPYGMWVQRQRARQISVPGEICHTYIRVSWWCFRQCLSPLANYGSSYPNL